jgi:hypothetical protein
MSSTARSRRRCGLLAAAVSAPFLVISTGTAPASAAPPEVVHFDDEVSFEVYCLDTNEDGVITEPSEDPEAPAADEPTYAVDARYTGTNRLRTTKGGQFFVSMDQYAFIEHFTDLVTGETFTVEADGLFHELRPRLVEGSENVYTFSFVDAGKVFTVRDADGNVVVRNRGVVKGNGVFDTLGDSMAGGVVLEMDVTPKGNFPRWDESFCDVALSLTRP